MTANPDTFVVDLSDKPDFILMGCDGIFDRFSNTSIANFIYSSLEEGRPPNVIIKDWMLKNQCPDNQSYRGGPAIARGTDNQTAILIVFK